MDRFQRFNSGRVIFFLLAIITIILGAAVLKITASVVLPFTIALLLAIVISPIVKFFEKFRIPRVISIVLVLVFLVGVLYFMGIVLFSSSRALITLYPKYEARLTEIYIYAARFFELPYDEHLSFFDNLWGQIGVRNRVRVMTFSLSNGLINLLKDAFFVLLYLIFLLLEASFFRNKLERAFEGPRAVQIKKITTGIMTQVTHYLSIKFVISLFNGILIGICLRVIGLEFAIVWGFLQFVVNFIPNIGTTALGVVVTAFSVVQFWPNPAPIVATALVMLLINAIIGSLVDPKIMGDRLGLSPLVVLISLLVWGWLWGFAGLILAVPMTAIIKIVCENIHMLEPVSILLGSRKAVMAMKSEEGEEAPQGPESSVQPNKD
jgi:predicted PurR-regulated permease PerM